MLPKKIADKIELPLEKSRLKVSPYGAKPFRVLGKYTGFITLRKIVTTTTWYIVNKNKIEPLLSGQTAEELGIITFNANPVDEDEAWVNSVSCSKLQQKGF